ncbi:hypothetical protein [Bradyrhizobium sp. SYSU BS000235]|uniref:hypothetical protein n=1 Tax=Bradyrhizobium sp. SYSU BS000235 TaxID=3411332 RepID=UPI003C70765C
MTLESMSIEQLAELREQVNTLLADRVSARQRELSGEAERLSALIAQPNGKNASQARPKRPVKYRDGDKEWSGVGTMPAWAKALGPDLEKHRVA